MSALELNQEENEPKRLTIFPLILFIIEPIYNLLFINMPTSFLFKSALLNLSFLETSYFPSLFKFLPDIHPGMLMRIRQAI